MTIVDFAIDADLTKHRNEAIVLEVDFSDRLASGVTLSAPAVAVGLESDTASNTWTDVSAEFSITSVAVAGADNDKVQFTLGAASGANQAEGVYYARVTATTSDGQTVVESPSLGVIAQASV